jgi:hypothetical protein
MSLEDLSALKNWLLGRIEATAAEKRVNGAAIIKQFQEQLRAVEAEIALKEKS